MQAWTTTKAGPDELLQAALAGDKARFGLLVAPHVRELHVHCYRMLGSLSVQGPCGQRSGWFQGLAAVGLAADRASGRGRCQWVERPQPKARTNDLDADQERRRIRRPATAASVRSWATSGRLGRAVVRAGAPSLIWVLAPWRGDKMIDGVIPWVRGRSVFQGRPRQRVTAGALREPAAAHLLRCGHRTHTDHLRRPRAAAGAAARSRPAPAPARRARPGRGGRGGPACAPPTGSRGWRSGGP
jgi:hypothetical protein